MEQDVTKCDSDHEEYRLPSRAIVASMTEMGKHREYARAIAAGKTVGEAVVALWPELSTVPNSRAYELGFEEGRATANARSAELEKRLDETWHKLACVVAAAGGMVSVSGMIRAQIWRFWEEPSDDLITLRTAWEKPRQ